MPVGWPELRRRCNGIAGWCLCIRIDKIVRDWPACWRRRGEAVGWHRGRPRRHRAAVGGERRQELERALGAARPPVHLTPARDLDTARRWFDLFEGAGLDGLIAKPLDLTYRPDKPVMAKIKHERTVWSPGIGCTSPARTWSGRCC